jgi:hypothetical protein
MDFTTSQLNVREFIRQNVPESLQRDEHINVLLDVIAIAYGDVIESDDTLKTLISIDNVPEEYLEDLGQLLGYEMDMTLDSQYQRLYMKQFLSSRKRRGTALGLKVVGASYSKDAQSFLESGTANDIEVVEYGINDQNYVPGVKEIWQPGTIAVTLMDGAQFVKQKLLAMTPAGIKLNLNTRQQVDIDRQAILKVNGYMAENTLNSWAALHPLFSEIQAIPLQWIFGLTLDEIAKKFYVEVGTDVTNMKEYFVTPNFKANSSDITTYEDLAKITVGLLAKSSSYSVDGIVGVSNGFPLESEFYLLGNLFPKTISQIEADTSIHRIVISENSTSDTTLKTSLSGTSFTASGNVSTNEYDRLLSVPSTIKQREVECDRLSRANLHFGVASGVNRLVEYFTQRIDDIKVGQFMPEADITYSYR